jgi:hypothetical protein
MALGHVSANKKTGLLKLVCLTLLLTFAGTTQVASAQYASTNGYGGGLGPDQDSLLPPEVVPLDPSTANSMATQQAEKRVQTGFGSGAEGQVPGLVNSGTNGMMTAQDYRKAAFNSLYGQGQLPQNQSQMQWQASGVSQNQVVGQNPDFGLGQNSMNSPTYAPYQPSSSMPASSQTLTGGTKSQPKIRDTRRGGFTNTVSSLASLGAGAFAAGALLHPQSPMVGAGIFGMTMTGFGNRNSFRF